MDEFIKFLNENKPQYKGQSNKGEVKICLETYHNISKFVSGKHYGWNKPTMYHDTLPENYCADLVEYDYTSGPGIFLKFTSDDYTERVYLKVKVLDLNTLVVLYDAYCPDMQGTKLYWETPTTMVCN